MTCAHKLRILKNMAVVPLPGAFKRRRRRPRRDRGRSAAGWRWFSDATIDAAAHFRDVRWRRIGLELAAALAVVAASRVDPGFALSPWLFIAGLIWLGAGVRMAALKALDHRFGEAGSADGPGDEVGVRHRVEDKAGAAPRD